MRNSKFKEILSEVIQEELKEISHTSDSSGKPVVAVGAPGSIERFAVEHPDIINQMRDWVKDCQWGDVADESDVDDFSNEQIVKGVQKYYDGGVKAFLKDSNSDGVAPVGLKDGLDKKTPPTTSPDDDVPFEEGFGYVHAKDRAKDPKSIRGDRWRVKFQSADDLKKHGNTEMSKVTENRKAKRFLQSLVKESIKELKNRNPNK